MSDQSDANPKITQVADPRFKRLNDAFAKYLLAKEDHIGFLEDFVKAVIDHTPADVPAHEVKSLVHRNVELYTLCSLESLFTFPSCMDRNKTKEKITAILRL